MTDLVPIERHPLRPFVPRGARLLMLGSFPPQQKRWSMNFFYPNIQNDMWRIFGLLYFGDKNHFYDAEARRFRLESLKPFLEKTGIALYDTATAVKRLKQNASDRFLEVIEETNIPALAATMPQCRAIAATGQKAAAVVCAQYGIALPGVGGHTQTEARAGDHRDAGLTIYRMPSSSRSYPLALEKKAAFYAAMLRREGLL